MAPTQVVLTILFGAIAGGVTNSVAIWMLFHPYEPPRLGKRRLTGLQGAIPKNKDRLARAMGRTVGTQLLTPEDLATALDRLELRQVFEDRLTAVVRGLLDRPRGTLSAELPAPVAAELRRLLDELSDSLLVRLRTYLDTEEFRESARGWADALALELKDRPLSEVLTPERAQSITDAAERWITEAVHGEAFEYAIDDYLERGTQRLLAPDRTFEQILPVDLVSPVEKAIAGYLPLAIERLGRLLDDPKARAGAQRVLHEVLDRFMRDLKFHQRLVAALLITPDTIDRVLTAVEAEGTGKLSELLRDAAMQDAMARGVNDAVVDFLRRPVRTVLGPPDGETVGKVRATLRRWALDLARDDHTAAFLAEKLRGTLASAERRTWSDLFRHVPPDRLADALVTAARSERATRLYRDAAHALVERVLDRPIGRLADHVPEDAAERIRAALAGPLWGWILDQVPTIVERVDIASRVEEKILEFPPQRVEQLIRGVTDRELKLIIRLGYVLGALIGLVSVGISVLTG